jgi:hypothetical protein
MAKVPVVGRFDESFDRSDFGLPERWPTLRQWAHFYSFPAFQDAVRLGGGEETWHPFAADTKVFRPFDEANAPKRLYDVAFIGGLYQKRVEYLKHLNRALHDLGHGTEVRCGNVLLQDLSGVRALQQTRMLADEYQKIKVFFCLPPLSNLIVCKAFEVMACGTFLMYPRLDGAASDNMRVFDHARHLHYYNSYNFEENAKQIEYFIDSWAQGVASHVASEGCKKVFAEYPLEKLLANLIGMVDGYRIDAPKAKPKWSILILTQPSRERYLDRLLSILEPQVREFKDVELCIKMFDGTRSLGENRTEMVRDARGTYVNFVDDDDLVSKDYVKLIRQNLVDDVDYIGFRVQCYWDGKKLLPTFHSLRYKNWHDDDKGYYRDLSHLNPIQRRHALKVPFDGGHGEDGRWADAMRTLGVVKTEHYIDAVMYEYYFRSKKHDGALGVAELPAERANRNYEVLQEKRRLFVAVVGEIPSTLVALLESLNEDYDILSVKNKNEGVERFRCTDCTDILLLDTNIDYDPVELLGTLKIAKNFIELPLGIVLMSRKVFEGIWSCRSDLKQCFYESVCPRSSERFTENQSFYILIQNLRFRVLTSQKGLEGGGKWQTLSTKTWKTDKPDLVAS